MQPKAYRQRAWYRCPCGTTFRSVVNRRRGLRECPSCHTKGEFPAVVPPAATGELATAESELLNAAISVVHAYANRCNIWSALQQLTRAEAAWRAAVGAPRDTPIPGRQLHTMPNL